MNTQVMEKEGIEVKRFFTSKDKHPYEQVKWVERDAEIKKVEDGKEKMVFQQKGVEFPDFWSPNAVNITASKYFHGRLGTPEREKSLKELIDRVVKTIREWGEKLGYFDSEEDAQIFEEELTYMVLHQKGSFNSPVWFNLGATPNPQVSACFILSVEDDMESILNWVKKEGMIFKGGSGAGVDLSPIRSKDEPLSRGGFASGPVSFMRGADSVAGMIKSGGTTRRAAKMVTLNVEHPDIMDFVRSKADEEDKIRALMEAGYDMTNINSSAWSSIQYQNANNSVRIPDEFMEKVNEDGKWQTRYRVSGDPAESYVAKKLLRDIAQATWECGDPGIQFDTTINHWHTCPNSGRINSSNPCAEYLHIDNSACNLASINLLRFIDENGVFMVDAFKQAVDIFFLAQEIMVGEASYPTEKIGENARKFRELGLGFTNIGAFLMAKGIPYDSKKAFSLAGAITSLMTGEAYRKSAEIASKIGPFEGFEENREPMLRVIGQHRDKSHDIDFSLLGNSYLEKESQEVWERALDLGEKFGYRNSQATVIAPTGTISFMMDCDTTGIEPDFSLVKKKQLVGGGWMDMVNESVKKSLTNLGYEESEREEIIDYVREEGDLEGAPHFKNEHLPIFDCAVAHEGKRRISWKGHIRMVAAVQPFVSGGISKTFNMPHDTTVEEIADAYKMAWEMGIKSFAAYRDGSKATQALYAGGKKNEAKSKGRWAKKHKLPDTRPGKTHKFTVGGHKGFLRYSTYPNGDLAEIFLDFSKQGSTLAGWAHVAAIAISVGFQHKVPFAEFAEKFINMKFEPAGLTSNAEIRIATSVVDYVMRFLAKEGFLTEEELEMLGINSNPDTDIRGEMVTSEENTKVSSNGRSPKYTGDICPSCGAPTLITTGSCSSCQTCGETSGCG